LIRLSIYGLRMGRQSPLRRRAASGSRNSSNCHAPRLTTMLISIWIRQIGTWLCAEIGGGVSFTLASGNETAGSGRSRRLRPAEFQPVPIGVQLL